MATLGYYGKLPRFGDFLEKRVSAAFVAQWDAWLSRCLVDAQRILADRWPDTYLSSPIWRFALSPEVCGPMAVTGILLPSVDAVERCYPFAIMAELPAGVPVIEQGLVTEGWYDDLERVALAALDEDEFNAEAFEQQLGALGDKLMDAAVSPEGAQVTADGAFVAEIAQGANWPDAMRRALELAVRSSRDRVTIWWTEGSPFVTRAVVVTDGLPTPRGFVSMMTGEWAGRSAVRCPDATNSAPPPVAEPSGTDEV